MEFLNSFDRLSLNEVAQDTLQVPSMSTRHHEGTIMQILGESKRFSMISEIIEKSGSLRNDLDNDSNSITFFAPTNEALCRFHDMVKGIEKRRGGGRRSRIDRPELPKMEEILKYHTVSEELSIKDLCDGQLLVSGLKVKELGDNGRDGKQVISVKRRLGSFYLNYYTRVEEVDIKASNGVVLAVDWVLMPPADAFEKIFMLPFLCSTFGSALQYCGLDEELMEMSGLTVFVPIDSAWMEMNIADLVYLFSPLGCSDLKKILEYHVCTEINYAVDMVEESKEIAIPTLLEEEEIVIRVVPAEKKRRDDNDDRRKGRKNGRGGRIVSPDQCLILINEGEARVKATDVITRNGNLHLINSVLIPEGVCLPSRRLNKGVNGSSLHGFGRFES